MPDDKELAYSLIAKYGRQWLKEESHGIYQKQEDLKKLPKAMRKPYEIAISKDKEFLFEVGKILQKQ